MNFEEDCKDLPAVGRRWVVVGLRRMRVAPAVVRIATGMAKQQQDKWLATYDATGDVQHEPTQGQRTDRAAVVAQSKETLKNLIDDGNPSLAFPNAEVLLRGAKAVLEWSKVGKEPPTQPS